jgi:hypothetical protein
VIEPDLLEQVERECPRGLAGMFHKSLFTHLHKVDSSNVWCVAPHAPFEILEILPFPTRAQTLLRQAVHLDALETRFTQP